MRIPAFFRAGALTACLGLLASGAAFGGTTILMARYHGDWLPVVRVRDDVPIVETRAGFVAASPNQYSLRALDPAPRGLPPPVIVDVVGLKMDLSAVEFVDSIQPINREISMQAKITAPVDLANVFIVMELHGERHGTMLFVHEVGSLRAGVPDLFEYRGRLDTSLGKVTYTARLYSDGFELIASAIGQAAIDREICERIRAEIEGVVNAKPRPYVLTPPKVPESVRRDGVRKVVAVTTAIGPDGRVGEARAEAGTADDLAAAAESAVRGSYFLPKVVDGRPVECRITIQVVIAPTST